MAVYNYKLRAANLAKKFGSADPLQIAASKGIITFTAALPHHVNGLWKQVLRRKFICYGSHLTEAWQIKAVVAHELGHIILHPRYHHYCADHRTIYACTKHEEEADAFAIALCSLSCTEDEMLAIRQFLQDGWRR